MQLLYQFLNPSHYLQGSFLFLGGTIARFDFGI